MEPSHQARALSSLLLPVFISDATSSRPSSFRPRTQICHCAHCSRRFLPRAAQPTPLPPTRRVSLAPPRHLRLTVAPPSQRPNLYRSRHDHRISPCSSLRCAQPSCSTQPARNHP
ncbi:hypothetical protein M0R45_015785 [Rubus argutus]|uniref:Uncharacterized protein n=1 Tax=Rubus argutus TaxID=59490 RepID=A0AAW1XQ84_RUBAR